MVVEARVKVAEKPLWGCNHKHQRKVRLNMSTKKNSEPELAYLPVDLLFVDHANYQRHKKASIIKKLGQWNWKRCQALQVSQRANGMYAILDGQHRYNLAIANGITELPCVVVEAESIKEEASVFHGINTARGPMQSFDYL